MNSYEILKNVSEGLYINLENEKDIEIRLGDAVQKIHSRISEDFNSLFGKDLKLESFQIYVDDETYRQSATGLILNETILDDKTFKIKIECLIDQGRIWIKVRERKENSNFNNISNRIEKVKNQEGLSELSEIK